MKIGILSDTHNNMGSLQAALMLFERKGITTLVHCGDLTGVEIARAMVGFRVICVFGNGDVASGEIRETLLARNPESSAGLVFSGRIGGARIGATHGHLPGKVEELVRSGEHDLVFVGHSHRHKEERIGFTRLINPGSLGGLQSEKRHVCVLDLEAGRAEFIHIHQEELQR